MGTLRFFRPKMASKLVIARQIPHSGKNSWNLDISR